MIIDKLTRLKEEIGYTLIELMMVIMVLSIIVSSGLSVYTTSTNSERLEETEDKMRYIVNALQDFVTTYGYLPCPADAAIASNNPQFGISVQYNVANGECDNLSGNYRYMLPVKTLAIDENYAFDGWNNKFYYRPSIRLSMKNDFDRQFVSGFPDPLYHYGNSMEIIDIKNNTITQIAAFALISYGKNGNGAWRKSGARKSVHSDASHLEYINNQHNTADPIYRSAGIGEKFDDIVVWYSKWQLEPINLPRPPFPPMVSFHSNPGDGINLCSDIAEPLLNNMPRDLYRNYAGNTDYRSYYEAIYRAAELNYRFCNSYNNYYFETLETSCPNNFEQTCDVFDGSCAEYNDSDPLTPNLHCYCPATNSGFDATENALYLDISDAIMGCDIPFE